MQHPSIAVQHDLDLLLKWVCLHQPGGRIAYLNGDAMPTLSGISTPLVEAVHFDEFFRSTPPLADRWRGLYLEIEEDGLRARPDLPAELRVRVDGPVLIRVANGTAETRPAIDNRFIQGGWGRHPLVMGAVGFVVLETESLSVLLGYFPIPEATARKHSLSSLALERNLHMDMLREAGRRADAHLARYAWAVEFVRPNDRVIDGACGLGYGSAILRAGSACASVLGFDCSATAVGYATDVYSQPWTNLQFEVRDLADLSAIASNSVDCFVSFETFEHLPDPRAFATEINRILKPGGRLLCSVPNRWVDETGRDPSPYHLHTYDLPSLLDTCREFQVEQLVGQCAGGSDPRFSEKRRFEVFNAVADITESRAQGVEWWLMAAMKSPVGASVPEYQESVFPALHHQPNTAPFHHGYRNPWIVHALVHFPFRLKSPTALIATARHVAAANPPGSADHGAALAVLAYRALAPTTAATREELEACRRAVREHLAVAPSAPHEFRWHISLSFVLGQLSLALGNQAGARSEFEACAALDFRKFSPHIATKTAEAAFQAGRLSLAAGLNDDARRNFERGLAIGRQLQGVAIETILIDPARPHMHGAGDGMREYVLAFDSVSRCANGLAILEQYERIGRADLSALDRSWQWEVQQLSQELRSLAADSRQRLEQVHALTQTCRSLESDLVRARAEVNELTELTKRHETESADRARQIDVLGGFLTTARNDAAARLKQVEELTELALKHESDALARNAQVDELTQLLKQTQADAAERIRQVDELTALLKQSQTDSVARSRQVDELTALLKQSQTDSVARSRQVDELTALLKQSQTDSVARSRQVGELAALFGRIEAEFKARLEQIETLTALLRQSQADCVARGAQVETLTSLAQGRDRDAVARAEQVDALTRLLQECQADSAIRARQIEQLTQLAAHTAEDNRQQRLQVASFAEWLKQAEANLAAVNAAHRSAEETVADLQRQVQAARAADARGSRAST